MLKKYLMFASLIGGMFVATQAKASDMIWEPRVGLQYQFSTFSVSSSYLQSLPKKLNHIGVMIGTKVHPMLGFDLEYMFSNERKKTIRLLAGSSFLGAAVGGADVDYTNRLKMNYVGLDINLFIPFNDNLSFIFAPGAFVSQPHFRFETSDTSNLSTALSQMKGKTKIVPRVTLGLEYIEQDVGIKAMFRWINAARIKIGQINTNVLSSGEPSQPYRDSFGMGFTVFVRV